MKNTIKDEKPNYARNLYLLSFLDISDRLDILMLEIRNIQQIIIYLLRAPILYKPLRHEESYIFGEWHKHTEQNEEKEALTITKKVLKLTKISIIRYPSPKGFNYYASHSKRKNNTTEIDDKTNAKKDQEQQIFEDIQDYIDHIWNSDIWVREQRRYYYALIALQVLKQQIFRDKLTLYERGKKLGIFIASDCHTQKPAFFVLRQGILHRIDEYLLNLRTHKQKLEKSLNFGSKEL